MKNGLILAIVAGLILPGVAESAAAQETTSGYDLPAICTSASASHDMGAMGHGNDNTSAMDQPHQDLMKGMDEMNAKMMQGMKASDPDVAFLCGMMPHHQGAIDMAKAELAHGNNPRAKELATKIIGTQEQEIAQMRAWLAEQK